VVIAGREVLAGGFRPYERLRTRRANEQAQTRDILRAGPAAAVLPVDAALAALPAGAVRNGPLVVALQWLALNRGRLAEIARAGTIPR
jgi:hypothetical protein